MSHSGNSPVVVFVTGYSEHAVSAFEHDALDYVLKPVSADRLATTLTKVRDSIKAKRLRERTAQAAATRKLQAARPKRLPIRVGNSVRLVRIDRILCATARDKHVYVRTRDEEFRTYYTLTQLEGLLPPERFMRIHASCIVDVESIEELVLWGNHSYSVKLPLGIDLPVGRQGYPELQARLGVTEVKKAAEE
jgi:two-component system LytT family response regulator